MSNAIQFAWTIWSVFQRFIAQTLDIDFAEFDEHASASSFLKANIVLGRDGIYGFFGCHRSASSFRRLIVESNPVQGRRVRHPLRRV
jgi:hypothetical protein